jgi:starch synthase (maltosyl-transferring)
MPAAQPLQSAAEILRHKAGRKRVVIEGLQPEIDCGRFPIKRVVAASVEVEADVFGDGHDQVAARLLHRREDETDWTMLPMEPLGNDRWQASFAVAGVGRYRYTVQGWVDHIGTWLADLLKRIAAGQKVDVEIQIGVDLIADAARRANADDADRLWNWVRAIREESNPEKRNAAATREDLVAIASHYPDPRFVTQYQKELAVIVDRCKAEFSAWYEVFPRSCSADADRPGTFRDLEGRLPYIASMGFDVLYLPPVHPIGVSFRKGKNNAPSAKPGDVGSPWAIGSSAGGHMAIDQALGTFQDFHRLLDRAKDFGLEVALDIAFQATPDHPYVSLHPEWFRKRPDGSIQYAENPPKKYQDIYPFDFDSEQWRELWQELKQVMVFWIEKGVRIFRIDNPHTKPFGFWEWAIGEIKTEFPDVLFLAEAFTRPRIMYRLAKLGFTQSYTYFAWRNTKEELIEYFTELTSAPVREFFRPNLWPNTPDILTAFLQTGGRPAFLIRYLLAATLSASYGIYGPAFELCENTAREPGSEEYLNSEKYEIKRWDLSAPQSLENLITRVNQIRRENPALQSNRNLKFHRVDNDQLIAYTKSNDDGSDTILTVVNLSPHYTHSGWLELPLEEFGLDAKKTFQMHDLLTDARFLWRGSRNYIQLNPTFSSAHIFRLRRHVRTEHDFDYFM